MKKKIKTELCGVCLTLLLTACGGPAEENRALPVVSVAQAEAVADGGTRNYTFISEPCRTTELAFRVGGPVQDFSVQSGQFFRKGQLIAAIDPRDFLVRKERAEALCRQAEADYRRTASLYEKNNVSGTAYEKARAGYARARADYDMALNELNDTRLIAPFDGYVQQVYIERHQEVKASQPVLTFIDLSQVKLETYVPEDMAVSLRRGVLDSVFQVRFDRLPGQEFTPVETYLTQTAADNNLSFRLTLLLDNPDNSLLGGMAGSLSISLPLTSASLPSLAIPQAAVCQDDCRGSYVWTVEDDGSVNRCPVTLGRLLKDSRVEVVSGLKLGQQVAVTRQAYLNEVANAAYGPQSNYAQCLVEAESPSVARQMQAGLQDELSQRFSDALVRVNRFELNSIPQALIEARFCGDDPRVLDSLTRLGLGKADLMTAVKSTGDGTAVGIYRDGDKQVPVLLRTAGGNNLSQDGLGDLAVWNGRNSAPLAQLTDSIALAWEWPLVKTYNRQLSMAAQCDVRPGHTMKEVLGEIRSEIERMQLPPGYTFFWDSQYKDQKEAMAALTKYFPLALVLLVLILVALFGNFRQPLLIFLILPLSVIGVVVGLLLTGFQFGFFCIAGWLGLLGMIIKNVIVLVDEVNLQRKAGVKASEAIVEATVSRTRPVLMAAVTTIFGSIPLLFDVVFGGMAATIVFGLSFATLLTLFVTPALYAVFYPEAAKK